MKLLSKSTYFGKAYDDILGLRFWFFMTLVVVSLILGFGALVMYALAGSVTSQAEWDMIDTYDCNTLGQWLKNHYGSYWYDTFHNKWEMRC